MALIPKLLLPTLGMTAFCSCSTQYNIDGNSTIAGLDGQKLYLRSATPGGDEHVTCLDSCEIVHGRFQFGGAVDSVQMVDLYIGDEPMMPVVIENGYLFVEMGNMVQTISGGPLNERLNSFLTKQSRYERELWDLNRRARNMLYEGKTVEQIVAVVDPVKSALLKQMKSLEVQFIKDNYSNALGPGYFMRMCNKTDIPVVSDDILDILVDAPAEFLKNPFVDDYVITMGITPELLQAEKAQRRKGEIGRKARKRLSRDAR